MSEAVQRFVLVKHGGPAPLTSISLLAHSSRSLRPRHAGLVCRGLPVGPLPESQSRAQPQLTGLGTRAAGRGLSPELSPRSTQAQNIVLQRSIG